MIIWGVFLPPPLKARTEYILRHYYQYPQRLPGGWLYLHCLLSGVLIVFWSDGQGVYVLFLTLLFLCLVMLFHIDNSVFYLPDKLVFPVLWAGLLFQNEVRLVTISSALYGVIGGFFCSGVWRKAMPGAGKKRPGRRGYQTVFCLRCLGGGGTARAVADAGLCVRAGGVRAAIFTSPLSSSPAMRPAHYCLRAAFNCGDDYGDGNDIRQSFSVTGSAFPSVIPHRVQPGSGCAEMRRPLPAAGSGSRRSGYAQITDGSHEYAAQYYQTEYH